MFDFLSGVAAVTDSITNFNNMVYGIYNTERNFDYQKHLHEYQKQVQQELWNREDNAVRRRAADLKAAGFNPLLAAGGAASTGAAVSGGFSNVSSPNFKSNASELVAGLLAMKKMQTDISMTRAQQSLLTEQARNQTLANELTKMTIQWYKDHPGYAPGVEGGLRSGKGLISLFDEVSNRLRYGFIYGSAGDGRLSRKAKEYMNRDDVREVMRQTANASVAGRKYL